MTSDPGVFHCLLSLFTGLEMPLPWTVRQIGAEDVLLPGYRSLRLQLWPECRDDCDGEIAQILARPDDWAVFVVSRGGHAPAGFLEVHLREYAEGARRSPVAFVEGWYVVPEQRGCGLGKALMKAAENWALDRGCDELASDTQIDNELSIAVHRRLGFHEMERLVCFLKRLDQESLS
jgi:aminoglycoside 6'-N-acetyltransferase I